MERKKGEEGEGGGEVEASKERMSGMTNTSVWLGQIRGNWELQQQSKSSTHTRKDGKSQNKIEISGEDSPVFRQMLPKKNTN